MYTTTSKQQEGCTFKDSHPTCFITTNFDKFHREAFARGGESRGKGKTRKRKNGNGKAEKRVKGGKAEKRVKDGKAEKRKKG